VYDMERRWRKFVWFGFLLLLLHSNKCISLFIQKLWMLSTDDLDDLSRLEDIHVLSIAGAWLSNQHTQFDLPSSCSTCETYAISTVGIVGRLSTAKRDVRAMKTMTIPGATIW
jgi:hypothetical protein